MSSLPKVKCSHQNNPGRTVLKTLLALFAIRTFLEAPLVPYPCRQQRKVLYLCTEGSVRTMTLTRVRRDRKVDELVDERIPEFLAPSFATNKSISRRYP